MRTLKLVIAYLAMALRGLASDLLSLFAPFHDLLVRMWRRRWRSRRNRRRFPSLGRPAFREVELWTTRPVTGVDGKRSDTAQLITFMT